MEKYIRLNAIKIIIASPDGFSMGSKKDSTKRSSVKKSTMPSFGGYEFISVGSHPESSTAVGALSTSVGGASSAVKAPIIFI